MKPLKTDLSIYNKFNFDRPPVGVKYLLEKPEGISQLDKRLALCEMLAEAHQRQSPFYISQENENCAGKVALGMQEPGAITLSGQLGVKFNIFQEARANSRLIYNVRDYYPQVVKGTINYVAFSPLEQLTFEPDLLMLTASPSQAEIVLRAVSYATGEIWEPKTTPVFACSWLFIYPYQTGKVNYTITGLSFGMKSKQVLPEGLLLISIPYDRIPSITHNLNEMEWVLPSYREGREKFLKRESEVMAEYRKTPSAG